MNERIDLKYYISFGAGEDDYYDDYDYTLYLTEKETIAYRRARKLHLSFDDIPELKAALVRAQKEIEAEAMEICQEYGDDEYVNECLGKVPVSIDEMAGLIRNEDYDAIAYFDIETQLKEMYLEKWIKEELPKEDMPYVEDFYYDRETTGEDLEGVLVSIDEMADLIRKEDYDAIAYFDIETELKEKYLEIWLEEELPKEEMPLVKDFFDDFVPTNPFTEAYSINLIYIDACEDDLNETEARATLTELFNEANGDYRAVNAYIERTKSKYEVKYVPKRGFVRGNLPKLAHEIAAELGIEDY